MPAQRYINATISALAINDSDIRAIHDWLDKWGPTLQRCLEWGGYREEIFEVLASEQALRELPQHLWVQGRQVSAPDQGARRMAANNE